MKSHTVVSLYMGANYHFPYNLTNGSVGLVMMMTHNYQPVPILLEFGSYRSMLHLYQILVNIIIE